MRTQAVIAAFAVLLFTACQTAELNRLKEENDSLAKARAQADRDSQSRSAEIASLRSDLETKDKVLKDEEARSKGAAKDLEDLRGKWSALSKDLAALKDENLRLMSALDEIRFAQSMQSHQNRGPYETKKYETPEKAEEKASGKTDSAKAPTPAPAAAPAKTAPALEAVSGIELRKDGGRTEYFDSLSNPDMDRGLFLSIEERDEGVILLRLNVVYSYAVAQEDLKSRIIGLGLSFDGRTFEIPFAPDDVKSLVKDGYRKEYVSLPLSSALAAGLKTAFSRGGEVRVLHVFPDYTRERIVTAAEKKSLLNVYYAFLEMGGVLR